MNKPRVVAFYLPQFYPTPENDEWWEPGFTEWTNVVRAKPLFKGHYQPRIPQELSFYDLRVPEIRERQAELAKEAGIEGFCYWHYWFGNGKRLLDRVFREVVESGKPDFPFCLCWANHSWFKKTWDPNSPNKLLIEQRYPGIDDYIAHFKEMLPAFKDKRYIRTSDGRLLFGIFAPRDFHDFPTFKEIWNKLAEENDLVGFEFFAYTQDSVNFNAAKSTCYDSIVYEALNDSFGCKRFSIDWFKKQVKKLKAYPPALIDYSRYVNCAINRFAELKDVIPCIDPMFDHSPRSKERGRILNNNDPKLWGKLCRETRRLVENNSKNKDRFIFIKAWNEWGEGNYMEPDCRFGKTYIEEAGKAFK